MSNRLFDYLYDAIEDLRAAGGYNGISLYTWANSDGRTIVRDDYYGIGEKRIFEI